MCTHTHTSVVNSVLQRCSRWEQPLFAKRHAIAAKIADVRAAKAIRMI